MSADQAGFIEGEHTADWELTVWAPDLPTLFEQAARGMYQLSGTRLQPHPKVVRSFELAADDRESLLVTFLAELLFLSEQEGLGFDEYALEVEPGRIHARLGGARLVSQDKEIKAVTYHNLRIQESERGVEVTIVFDV